MRVEKKLDRGGMADPYVNTLDDVGG